MDNCEKCGVKICPSNSFEGCCLSCAADTLADTLRSAPKMQAENEQLNAQLATLRDERS